MTEEEAPSGLEREESTDEVKTKVRLVCPKCQVGYEIGNYCGRCGSLLVRRVVPLGADAQPLEEKSIKKLSKEWLRLSEEKKKMETCLTRLEAQRDRVSSHTLDSLLTRYQEQLDALSVSHQEMEAELESVRKKASQEIDLMERELQPIQKRLAELESLYQSRAMTKTDFSKEKSEMMRQIGLRERSLEKHRHILSILPRKLGGQMVSHRFAGNFLHPFPLTISAGVIALAVVLGYFFWQPASSSDTPLATEMASPSPEAPPPLHQAPVSRNEENEKIRSLFENIRQANLQKNIGLLMSCYARDFKDREGKRLAALETWENFNYLDLSYQLKKKEIKGDTGDIKVEWLIRTSPKAGGKPQERRTVLDVTLSREDGNWKIKTIRSAS
ncbi:MAG: hypothetical protein ACUVWO_12975 [Thermodesulfobacteriota bacterium]